MRTGKKFLFLAMLLLMYLGAGGVLLRSFFVYYKAYQNLSRLISHPSIETSYENGNRED